MTSVVPSRHCIQVRVINKKPSASTRDAHIIALHIFPWQAGELSSVEMAAAAASPFAAGTDGALAGGTPFTGRRF